jgi:parvulin-like peptidyl-prolyl isomerase
MMKADPKNPASARQATFEEAKADIEKYFKEIEARKMLKEKSDEIYKNLLERIDNKKETFAKAASKLGLDVKDTDFFSKRDTVEAIGDVPYIVEVARELKDLELSKPLEINKGYIIFEVTGRKDADEEAFAKDKEEFSKKMRDAKANIVMEKWLKDLENKAKLVIKLEDMEKHYQ